MEAPFSVSGEIVFAFTLSPGLAFFALILVSSSACTWGLLAAASSWARAAAVSTKGIRKRERMGFPRRVYRDRSRLWDASLHDREHELKTLAELEIFRRRYEFRCVPWAGFDLQPD